jgi:outer membrane protein OmpA-like peptidoglycan-associated protein
VAARRRADPDEGGSFWISYSDMTTGLLLVFILLVAVLVKRREAEMDRQQAVLDQVEEEVRQMLGRRVVLADKLEQAVETANEQIGLDVFSWQDGEVTVSDQEASWFVSNSAALTAEGKAHIRTFYVQLYDRLLTDGEGHPQIPDFLASIEIQGHTDPVPRGAGAPWSWESYNGSPHSGQQQDSNLHLSQLRAKAILDYVQQLYASGDPEFTDERRPWRPFVAMVESTGRAWTRSYCEGEEGAQALTANDFMSPTPCATLGGNDAEANRASRRVTFSFRLDDAEILERLKATLEGRAPDEAHATADAGELAPDELPPGGPSPEAPTEPAPRP